MKEDSEEDQIPRVWVIIPMYNFAELTDACIERVNENAGIPCGILVVDDGSHEPYKNQNNHVYVVRLSENMGFTKAVNEGLRVLRGSYDYVCLLNNDTIPQPNFLKNMVELAEKDDGIGIVGASRISRWEPYQVGMWGEDLTTGMVAASDHDLENPVQAIWIPFCCVLFSQECVESIGLLDERMRNHCSDNDYCLRAVMMDFAVVFHPAAKVFHYQSRTIGHERILPYEDQKVFVKKWFGPAMNEILDRLPVNLEMNKYGKIGFAYEVREPEKPRIILP